VEINLVLSLPRDELSIPVVRHLCVNALGELGVTDECCSDISVALTEACTNVLVHSGPGDEYEVRVAIDGAACVIRIVDAGHGFDSENLATGGAAEPSAESGRGIQLIRALVDAVTFESKPEDGTVVHLEKQLDFVEGSPMRRLKPSA
jgi:serine/threonine-protein kinase RsbW